MVMRTPKKKRGHKFIPSPASQAKPEYKYCDICFRMQHSRRHQPLWWRITHKRLYR